MAKQHFTVVRNAAYTSASVEVRERHNERKNEMYYNSDVVSKRAAMNVHFKRCEGTYQQEFDRMIVDGTIVKRGLKTDAKVVDELVFDVNSEYFDERGGYDFAKSFFAEAYRLAVAEVGGEQYILSAVMHADERNSALSEQFGRDVYHYHLHVVYVPVVEKEVLWTKRCKDPALVGTVKEVIPQISHSKKWPRIKGVDGKWINSYSLLQDRYFEHMRTAGFDGFERGERGSTAEHLDVLDYKIQQDEKRLDSLDTKIEKKQERVEKLDEKITVKQTKAATLAEIDEIGKPAMLGGVHLTGDEAKRLKSLARQTVKSDERMAKLKRDMDTLQTEMDEVKRDRDKWKSAYQRLFNEVKPFLEAIRKFPQKLLEFIATLFPQVHTREIPQQHKKSQDIGR